MTDSEVQLYSIELPVLLGTEHTTWGSIKKIHK
jgi:hypothetical protein